MQEEVQKALKIHRANKELNSKNAALKKELEKVQSEHRAEMKKHQSVVEGLNLQIEQLKMEKDKGSQDAEATISNLRQEGTELSKKLEEVQEQLQKAL